MISKSRTVTQFEIPELWQVYSQQPNYEIHELNSTGTRCIIYFSSNGIYYPNDSLTFHRKIIQNNYFEWKNNIVTSARRVIFIRDTLKQWYLKGINSELNTIDKLLNFLQERTQGLKVTCVGSSAGGYAATLFGCMLGAERVFSFSGQFSLHPYIKEEVSRLENPILVDYENITEVNKYYSITELIETSKVPIFYFYPSGSAIDIEQADYIDNTNNVYKYSFDSREHGRICYPINFLNLFQLSNEKLISLYLRHKHKNLNSLFFSLYISGYRKTLPYLTSRFTKRITQCI